MIHINIKKAGYSGNTVLENFKQEIQDGEILTVLGASGCGKSTLLKIIAGIYVPGLSFEGTIEIDGAKKIGFIPQNKCLLPWKTVYENIALLVKAAKLKPDSIKAKLLIERLGLLGLENKYPSNISGGQYQRAMLGQAFFYEPDILLMDEPFTALDRETKNEIIRLFLELQNERNIPCIFVTHDLSEAEEIIKSGRGRQICL